MRTARTAPTGLLVVAAGSGGVDPQWGEPLYPAEQCVVADDDAAFGEEFLAVPAGQA
jgi:hypothetical protein